MGNFYSHLLDKDYAKLSERELEDSIEQLQRLLAIQKNALEQKSRYISEKKKQKVKLAEEKSGQRIQFEIDAIETSIGNQ